jgi:hypothetical protein
MAGSRPILRGRPRVWAGLAVVIVTLLAAVSASAGASPRGCKALQPTAVTYFNLDGSPASGPGPETATVVHYELAAGDDIREVVPPASFDPLAATNSQLVLLGLPPRPTDADALAAWLETYKGYKGTGLSLMCTTHRTVGMAI